MLSKIKQSWKVKDVRRRILYTLMMILIFRIGTTIPVPDVNTSIISSLVSGNSLLALYNMFTGGAFSNFTLFALGIGPYITASIIIQLLTVGFESLKELQKSGEEGRKKMNMYTKYTALVLAIIQAVGYNSRSYKECIDIGQYFLYCYSYHDISFSKYDINVDG